MQTRGYAQEKSKLTLFCSRVFPSLSEKILRVKLKMKKKAVWTLLEDNFS